jgi:hypothetical protein
MSSNYNLQDGKDWIMNTTLTIDKALQTNDSTAEKMKIINEEASNELFSCDDDKSNKGMIGCEFKSKESVETYCNGKNDCIGYLTLKFNNNQLFFPTKKTPGKMTEKMKNDIGEVSYYKHKDRDDKILGMDKNTFYIVLGVGVIILIIIIGLIIRSFLK